MVEFIFNEQYLLFKITKKYFDIFGKVDLPFGKGSECSESILLLLKVNKSLKKKIRCKKKCRGAVEEIRRLESFLL